VAICIIAVFGQGFQQLVLTLGFLSWPVFARVVYAEALSLLEREYVLSAQLIGVNRLIILYRHVLPGLRATLMVMLAFHFADMLIAESALSFLGIGAPLGEPTWGNMLAASRDKLFQAPWMMLVPASAIVLAVVTANLVGDGIATVSRRLGKGIDL
jgi:peptide/nickel transport system permease protein